MEPRHRLSTLNKGTTIGKLAGVYKVPYPPPLSGKGKLIKSVGEEYQVVNKLIGEGNILAVEKNKTWMKRENMMILRLLGRISNREEGTRYLTFGKKEVFFFFFLNRESDRRLNKNVNFETVPVFMY